MPWLQRAVARPSLFRRGSFCCSRSLGGLLLLLHQPRTSLLFTPLTWCKQPLTRRHSSITRAKSLNQQRARAASSHSSSLYSSATPSFRVDVPSLVLCNAWHSPFALIAVCLAVCLHRPQLPLRVCRCCPPALSCATHRIVTTWTRPLPSSPLQLGHLQPRLARVAN